MATTTTCDVVKPNGNVCGKPAADAIEVKSKLTTSIKMDVCEEHLADFKKAIRKFTGQDLEEVVQQ